MPSYDSIVVGEDWISEHYFTTDSPRESFQGKVIELRKQWDAEAAEGRDTVRRRLLGAAGEIQTELSTLVENPDGAAAAHALTRTTLGFPEPLADYTGERAGTELRLSNARPAGVTSTLFLQAAPVESVDDLLDPETGLLLEAGEEDGKPIESVSKAVSAVFRADEPPAFVVVQAGQWVLLTEAQRWAEGRYLAVDLLVVTERREEKRGGELDRAAAILGRQSLLPDADGNIWWTGVLEDSVKHTVGVSKDLREGIRLSIEIIANDVVRRRAARDLPLDDIDAQQLAKHALRFLYRILFLLYAEASPELRVLPSGAPEYGEGYGLDRLRELTLTEMVSPTAKAGTHLYQSLATLFRLVDHGHAPRSPETAGADDPAPGLEFNALRADLFDPKATSLIDQVGLSNEATQQVLQHLLLSKESKGRKGSDRGFISYAELGINQLGAVYEGLMSYTGFFAAEDLYEVAKNGDPEKGSWVVPVSRADHLSETDFVMTVDEATGEQIPVIHRQGTFVFRLAGRERQQSASYYTPEVLTKFVVSQALEELLDQNDERTTPEQILQLTICEPALGSGAFAIEAVRQLAAEYLKRQQEDRGEVIDADQYQVELQKVKAHIALHQVYGVDLNATAVELAEISLWLDTMVAGLQAPWFGLHLRRGNSLIGARRAVYAPSLLTKKAWLTTAPKDIPLGDEIGAGMHHFLLPSHGWGAVIDTPEAKIYAPDRREELRLWRNGIRGNPSAAIKKRLAALAERVETLWAFTLRRLTIAESEIRRDIDIWGLEPAQSSPDAVTREQIETVLHDENGAFRRLRRVMDAWCALWSWPLTTDIEPPDWDQWVGGLEAILGVPPRAGKFEKYGQTSLAGDLSWSELDVAEDTDRAFSQALPIEKALDGFPWLRVSEFIAETQGFFHWELDFAPVFARDGFDLQVGNPPWVRPDWDEAAALAEFDPSWKLAPAADQDQLDRRRSATLEVPGAFAGVLQGVTDTIATREFLNSSANYPIGAGGRRDLYHGFIETCWRGRAAQGVVALVHPVTHLTAPRLGTFRRECYARLLRLWHFQNKLTLFEIDSKEEFAVNLYGCAGDISFKSMSFGFHPSTVERSIVHDGSGPVPCMSDDSGKPNISPHSHRIFRIQAATVRAWAELLDGDSGEGHAGRMPFLLNRESASVLEKLTRAPRISAVDAVFNGGWNETTSRTDGVFDFDKIEMRNWNESVLLAANLSVSNPFSSEPVPDGDGQSRSIDLESLGDDAKPCTRYARRISLDEFQERFFQSSSVSNFSAWWREWIKPGNIRALQPAIYPPTATHVNAILSLQVAGNAYTNNRIVANLVGQLSSIPADFLAKSANKTHLAKSLMKQFPLVLRHVLTPQLLLRTLRLNCLSRAYAPLWRELYASEWRQDSWISGVGADYIGRSQLGDVGSEWDWATPLRRAADRRQALVEIDAIVAIMLDITAEELLTIYRTQFPVLQKYERDALYDANGRQLPGRLASEYRKGKAKAEDFTVDGVTLVEPFVGVDRERDMELAHKHFSALIGTR